MDNNSTLNKRQVLHELVRRKCKSSALALLKLCWWEPNPLMIGKHTQEICKAFDEAITRFENKESTFLLIQVPFRHGKSILVSQLLPAYFLGRCQKLQPSVIMSGYGMSLLSGFSKRVKRIIESDKYQLIFSGVKIEHGNNSDSQWSIEGSMGSVNVAGIGGSITGKGGHLIICDDVVKNIQEARSETYRNRTWDSFRNDLMSRRNSPASIVILCGTPWHTSDVLARTKKEMESNPDFPKFKELKFPARQDNGEYLFQNLLGTQWYKEQYATQAKLSTALLDLEPVSEGGNLFNIDNIMYHDNITEFPQRPLARCWDLASSIKERSSSNPDWTVGIKGCVTKVGQINHLWIYNINACREEAPKRNDLIISSVKQDGPTCRQYIENFGAYKDAHATLKEVLKGIAIVNPLRMPGDKQMKAAPLEIPFSIPNCIHIYLPGCSKHLQEFKLQVSTFPHGTHDDFVDAIAMLYHVFTKSSSSGFLL